MRVFLWLALLMFVSCGHGNYLCVTNCGLRATQLPQRWDCSTLQKVEDVSLKHFQSTALDPRLWKCDNLSTYELKVHDTQSWTTSDKREVEGLTYCDKGYMEIGNSSWPSNSSLPHEMVHALQDCVPRPPHITGDAHETWGQDQINKALYDIAVELP